jgi:hypothetical protein
MWAARPSWAPPVAYRPVQRGYVGSAWQARAGMRGSSGAWAYALPAPRFVGRWTAPTPRWSGVIPPQPFFRPAPRPLARVAAPVLVQGSWPWRSPRPGTYRFRPLRVGDRPLVIRLPAVPVLEPHPAVAPDASDSAGGRAASAYTSPTWGWPAGRLDALTGTAGSPRPVPVSRVSGALAVGDPPSHPHRWATPMAALVPIRPRSRLDSGLFYCGKADIGRISRSICSAHPGAEPLWGCRANLLRADLSSTSYGYSILRPVNGTSLCHYSPQSIKKSDSTPLPLATNAQVRRAAKVVSPQPAPPAASGLAAAWARRSATGAAYDGRTDWPGRGSAVALAVPRESSASDRRRPSPSG